MWCRVLDRVSDCQNTGDRTIHRHKDGRFALVLKRSGGRFQFVQTTDVLSAQEIRFPDEDGSSSDLSGHATSGHGVEIIHRQKRDVLFSRAAHDGGGQRVLAVLFERRGEFQDLVRSKSNGGNHVGQIRPAFGQRSGLIDNERVDFSESFECLGVFHEHTFPRAASHADHDRHRCGQSERARACNDQHGHRIDQGMGEFRFRAEPHPQDEGEDGNRQHRRHEERGDLVGESLDRRAAALGLRHHVHDLT